MPSGIPSWRASESAIGRAGSGVRSVISFSASRAASRSARVAPPECAPVHVLLAHALTKAFDDNEFQLMTTQQINDTISDVIFDGDAASAYASAVSIFDGLGGGPLAGTTAWDNRNSFDLRRELAPHAGVARRAEQAQVAGRGTHPGAPRRRRKHALAVRSCGVTCVRGNYTFFLCP
eukprot:COSAG03_NODE_356_length_8629_cov_11.099965_4_plen_177_part_00